VSCTTIYPGYVESEIAQVDNDGVYHPERADKRPQRFMWSVDRAARVMVAAITRRQRDFVFTWHGKFGAWIGRHAPWFAHFVLTRGRK
jgi:short-subunit dehydrogenase